MPPAIITKPKQDQISGSPDSTMPPTQPPLLGPDYDDFYNISDEINHSPRPHFNYTDDEQRSNIVEFYHQRSVLITGASGFIGKVLIEKLLRTCPTLRRIYVLIRPKHNKQPSERLKELLEAPLFDGVRSTDLKQRVVLVEGDVTERNLGLGQCDLLEILGQVSVVFHSAATVKFDEPLKQSIGINIGGTKNMIELCRRLPHLAALVHVSTAYANCQLPEIDEHVYPDQTQQVDPDHLIHMAQWLDQDTLQELKRRLLCARPNTYTYTKAVAENLLIKSARDLPVVVCRPSIVVASWREPFAGWIDNVNGPTGILLGTGKGLIRSMFAEPSFVADLIPVDTTINLLVALGWFAHLYKGQKLPQQQQLAAIAHADRPPSSYLVELANATSVEDECHVDCSAEDRGSLGTCDNLSPSSSASFAGSSASHSGAHSDADAEHEHDQTHETLTASASDDQLALASINCNSNSSSTQVASLDCSQTMAKEAEEEAANNNNPACDQDNYNRNYPRQQQQLQQQQQPILPPITRSSSNNIDYGYGSSRSSSDYAQSVASSSASSRSSSSSAHHGPLRTNSSGSRNDKTTGDILGGREQQQQSSSLNEQSAPTATTDCSRSNTAKAKVKLFRQKLSSKLAGKNLPEELADVPVFHCTSGNENPITWGQIQVLVVGYLILFPTIKAYRYPSAAFTNNSRLDYLYSLTLHYIPGYILDSFARFRGDKPIIVRIFRKFDQAAAVLRAFTSKQWKFTPDNRRMLYNEIMNDEDRRLFNCDIQQLDWKQYLLDYSLGVKKFMLKESMSNLEQARKNLRFLYYRNLSLQALIWTLGAYYLIPASFLSGFMGSLMGQPIVS